ncbi:MAG TPA: folylpolyglutamate synthase/dihydrofolate synthase family protein [bacterium]|nr:folylpolyglutamate synthase/dihydrofolate synthase family protein [bacterium]HOM26418.1 folylpolyglutamate synthase/dihydrofolate synthase family protein [bacterium]
MNNLTPLEFLDSLSDFGIKLGLDKTIYYLEKLGNPHYKYPSVLVAGTNGKGSVCKTLSKILQTSGYRVGLYTSPHLIDVKERIRINEEKIKEKDFIEKIEQLRKLIEKQPYHLYPTYFEALTIIAFSYFYDKKIDILVCEVGMGGRFDATNVLPSFLEIITKIGLDHTEFLGKTYKMIANEKAGIIKEKTMVISAKQKKDAIDVIKKKVKDKKGELFIYGEDFKGRIVSLSPSGMIFDFNGREKYKNLKTDLLGTHQVENLSIAIEAGLILKEKGYMIKEKDIREAIKNINWKARFQILQKNPYIIFDGAHNVDGVKNLMKNVKKIFPDTRFNYLVGILKDKDYKNMVKIFEKHAGKIILTKPNSDRAIEPSVLKGLLKNKKNVKIIENPEEAYKYIKGTKENWLIFGSLYLASSILTE